MMNSLRTNTRLYALLSLLLFATSPSRAENPSWNGHEFQLLVRENTIPPGSSLPILFQEVVPSSQGLYIYSRLASRRGQDFALYLLEGTNYTTILSTEFSQNSTLMSLRHVGLLADGSLLFEPRFNTGSNAILRWNKQTDVFLGPSSSVTDPLYARGQLLYSEKDSNGLVTISMGPPGQPQPQLSSSTQLGLGSHIAFDGTQFVYYTGHLNSNNLALWLHTPGGSTLRILTNNQIVPFGTKPLDLTSMITVDNPNVFLDQGNAYLTLNGGVRERSPDRVLVRTLGDGNFEPLLALNQTNHGIHGIAVTSFNVGSVNDGVLTAAITLRSGLHGLYVWQNGVWSLITTNNALFESKPAESYTLYRHGQRGDSLTMRVNVGSGSRPTYQLYSTDFRQEWTPLLRWISSRAGFATLSLEGKPHTVYSVFSSDQMMTWALAFEIQTSETGQALRELPTTFPQRFYRLSPPHVGDGPRHPSHHQ